MSKHETVTIKRDVEGTAIPAGNKIFVPQETVVTITQMSAAHSSEDVARCIDTFAHVGRELGVIR